MGKEIATHSSVLAWEIPQTEESGRLQAMGSQKSQMRPKNRNNDQPWDFFGRDDAKAETPVLWPPYAKS